MEPLTRAARAALRTLVLFLTLLLACQPEQEGVGRRADALAVSFGATARRSTTLASGVDHTCAVKADGTVWCWGSNTKGQLGQATAGTFSQPVQVPGIQDAVAVVSGVYFSCALRAGGFVSCWGDNTYGTLGVGAATPATSALPLNVWFEDASHVKQTIHDAVAITAGFYHACVIRLGDTADLARVFCWGQSTFGQIGANASTSTSAYAALGVVKAVGLGPLEGAVAIGSGAYHTCAVDQYGALLCWGYNLNKQLGRPAGDPSQQNVAVQASIPTASPTIKPVEIAGGINHTCIRDSIGRVTCWGGNDYGQMGLGATGADQYASASAPIPGVVARSISAKQWTTCAIEANGTAHCWGYNGYGQAGNGTTSTPASASTTTSFGNYTPVAISVGQWHACAETSNGQVTCWGRNDSGQLGNGSTTNQYLAGWTPSATTYQAANSIDAGGYHACLVAGDGRVRCWGRNVEGQLGDGTTVTASRFVTAAGLFGARSVSAGNAHTCATTAQGEVRCWGRNSVGQIGDGTIVSRSTPTAVGGLTTAVDVQAGFAHTCALLVNGTVRCWGDNTYGQLGSGTMGVGSTTPVQVGSLTDVVAISASGNHTCAVLADATPRCWGMNNRGQLGNGSTVHSLVPVQPKWASGAALTLIASVSAGTYTTCALSMDGTVDCWGDDTYRQLGLNCSNLGSPEGCTDTPMSGDATPRSSAILGIPLTNAGSSKRFVQVSAGARHACGVLADGAVACWGSNEYLAIGNSIAGIQLPTVLADRGPFVSVAAGEYTNCGVLADGTTQCWGNGAEGQVGNGASLDSESAQVAGLTRACLPEYARCSVAWDCCDGTCTDGLCISGACTLPPAGTLCTAGTTSTSALCDTTDGVQMARVFDNYALDTVYGLAGSAEGFDSNYRFGWGISNSHFVPSPAHAAPYPASWYFPFNRERSGTLATADWWKGSEPGSSTTRLDWLMYTCDTSGNPIGLAPGEGESPTFHLNTIDISNPEVRAYQAQLVGSTSSNPYRYAAADNVVLNNEYRVCGHYIGCTAVGSAPPHLCTTPGATFQRLYDPIDPRDQRWTRDVIAWMKDMKVRLAAHSPPKGLVVNLTPSSRYARDYWIKQLGPTAVDAIMAEGGYSFSTGEDRWTDLLGHQEAVQRAGLGIVIADEVDRRDLFLSGPHTVYSSSTCGGTSQLICSNFAGSGAGSPAALSTASYLMGKERSAFLSTTAVLSTCGTPSGTQQQYGCAIDLPETQAAIGRACGCPYRVKDVYIRHHTNGVSIVNPSAAGAPAVTLVTAAGYTFREPGVGGAAWSSTFSVAPRQARWGLIVPPGGTPPDPCATAARFTSP